MGGFGLAGRARRLGGLLARSPRPPPPRPPNRTHAPCCFKPTCPHVLSHASPSPLPFPRFRAGLVPTDPPLLCTITLGWYLQTPPFSVPLLWAGIYSPPPFSVPSLRSPPPRPPSPSQVLPRQGGRLRQVPRRLRARHPLAPRWLMVLVLLRDGAAKACAAKACAARACAVSAAASACAAAAGGV